MWSSSPEETGVIRSCRQAVAYRLLKKVPEILNKQVAAPAMVEAKRTNKPPQSGGQKYQLRGLTGWFCPFHRDPGSRERYLMPSVHLFW